MPILDFHFQEHVLDIPPTVKIGKDDFLNLKSNELLNMPKPLINKWLSEILCENVSSYPSYDRIYTAMADFFEIDKCHLLLTAGSDEAIKLLNYSLFKKTQNLYLQHPNYASYERYGQLFEHKLNLVPVREIYQHNANDFKNLENVPGIIIIANPNGFTGQSFCLSELSLICESAKSKNQMLVVDEAYSDFSTESCLPLIKEFDNLILIKSFSKNFGLAGSRISALISRPDIISYLARWFPETPLSGPTIAITLSALKQKEQIYQVRKDLIGLRNAFIQKLSVFSEFRALNTKSNFILLELKSSNLSFDLFRYLKSKQIYVGELTRVSGFERCIRLTVCEEREQFILVEAIQEWLKQ